MSSGGLYLDTATRVGMRLGELDTTAATRLRISPRDVCSSATRSEDGRTVDVIGDDDVALMVSARSRAQYWWWIARMPRTVTRISQRQGRAASSTGSIRDYPSTTKFKAPHFQNAYWALSV